jgi:hypothetical protein
MASGRLAAALAGDRAAAAFAPYLWRLAADRAGLAVDEMAASPSELVAALGSAARLVEADAVHVLIDSATAPAVESLRRLAAARSPWDLVAVVPGPALLGPRHGTDDLDDAVELAEDLARVVLEAGCSVLAVREPDAAHSECRGFRSLARMAAHYGARTMVLGPPAAAVAVDAGFDAVDAGAEGPSPAGVHVALEPGPGVRIVTSRWSPMPGGVDADDLRATSRRLHRRETLTCQ